VDAHAVEGNRMPRRSARGVLRSAALVAASSGVANAAMGGIALLTARQLGPSGRGFIVVVVTLGSLTMLVSTLGTNLSARVLLPDARRPVALDDFLGLALALSLAQWILTAAAGTVLLPLAGIAWRPEDVALVGGYGAALLTSLLWREALLAMGRPRHAVSAEAAGALAQLALTGLLVALGSTAPRAYLVVLLLGALAQAAIAWALLRRECGPIRPSCRPGAWRRLVTAGAPGLGLTLGQAVAFKGDRLLLGVFLTPAVVGIYSVAATVTELLWIAPVALAQVLVHPVAARQADYRAVARARNAALLSVAACAAAVAVLAPALVRLVFGPAFAPAAAPLRILLLGSVVVTSYHVDVNALAASGSISHAGLVASAGATVALAAGLLLIPSSGAVGAAWASVGAYVVMAGLARARLRMALADRPRAAAVEVPA
jgi:O-antigen/teichoic acid export membrane protein